MTQTTPDTLNLSRTLLRALVKLNIVFGLLIAVLLIASLVAETWVIEALHAKPWMIMGMRSIMIVGICSIPFTHVVLTRLLAIVDTVGDGNPFVLENAARLQTIAWAVVALEMLHFVVGGIVVLASTASDKIDVDWNFSISRWITILLLFVLARVFEQGARMREELEGTV